MFHCVIFQVQVRPLVMGLTEVGRDNSHVLMAMGFREVDNVLTSAVLHGTGEWVIFGDTGNDILSYSEI